MSRNQIIRFVLSFVGGVALGATFNWVVAYASLSVFIAFALWLLMLVLAWMLGGLISSVATNARIDAVCNHMAQAKDWVFSFFDRDVVVVKAEWELA